MRQPLKRKALPFYLTPKSLQFSDHYWLQSSNLKNPSQTNIVIKVCWWANLDDQVGLGDDDEECHVGPGEERELPHVVLLLQRKHEPHKPENVPEFKNEKKKKLQ